MSVPASKAALVLSTIDVIVGVAGAAPKAVVGKALKIRAIRAAKRGAFS